MPTAKTRKVILLDANRENPRTVTVDGTDQTRQVIVDGAAYDHVSDHTAADGEVTLEYAWSAKVR